MNGVINNNRDSYNFIGVLKPKLYSSIYSLETNYNDNEPIILDGLNKILQLRVKIKSLTSTPFNNITR
jgi:hypothetical protein